MSRASASSQRGLTLTEELEKLEQSITLTLQEIDHNFSRAHRIVTTSILPIVEQYASHSKNVWEGSKFWKQFFEASANVSLSGYEETPPDDETFTATSSLTDATPSSTDAPSPPAHDLTSTPTSTHNPNHNHDSTADSPTFSSPATHSTPRAPTLATYSSPYETLRQELLPSTPRPPASSPFLPPSTATTARPARTPAHDPLLHRVLDKNYRVLATPHAPPTIPTHAPARRALSPDSSPIAPPPALRADLYGTPGRQRVPGVSVLATPGKGGGWESDSDEEGLPAGMSPPKTMQFYVPQSKLLKTPAREASKRIVEGLLRTAGGSVTEEEEEEPDDSPSVVGRGALLEEDTF